MTKGPMTKETPRGDEETAELILRDDLAVMRTHLANERTLLAYLRSGIALMIAGVTIVHFAEQEWFKAVGVLCVPGGAFACWIGLMRFRRAQWMIARRAARLGRR